MKNPGYASRTANFQLFPSGVKLSYDHYTSVSAVDNVAEEAVAASSGDDGAAPVAPPVATPVATPVAKGGYRKLRKTRKAKNVKSTRKMKKTSKLRR
jgi:hypothetical protein